MPKAAPSTRASDSVTFSFGLITLPLALYSGVVSSHGISRKEFLEIEGEDDHPVGRGAVDKVTGELIDNSKVVRKIETEHGFVYVSDEEIEKLFTINPKTMTLISFQPLALFVSGEHYIPKSQYFVEPAKTKVGTKKVVPKGTADAFAMLTKAMREEGVFALVEYTSRGVPKPAALMPNGTLWLLHHTDATREQRPTDEVDLNPQAVQMGRMLINQNLSNEAQDISDKRSELIQAFADEKAAAGDFAKPADTFREAELKAAPDDLMALLAASLDAASAGQAEAV